MKARIIDVDINGIAATLHLPNIEKPPVIVMCHGLLGYKDSPARIKIAERFCNEGFAVLRFDFYGHGKSKGKFEDFTISIALDNLKEVLEWICSQSYLNFEKIGVQGASLGGTIAMLLSSKHEKIKCLVTWGSPFKVSTGRVRGRFRAIYKTDIPKWFYEDAKKLSLFNGIKEITVPILVIHGKADDIVDPSHAMEIFNVSKGPREVVFVDGGHDLKEVHEVYKLTLDWFKKWLM